MNLPGELDEFTTKIVSALQIVAGTSSVALHEPEFIGKEWDYLKECLDTNFVSSAGKFVDKFERSLEEYTGSRHVIAVSNGTSALHIALLLAGIEPGDEVLIPALTFVATANAVTYCGASPHFVDSEVFSLGIDPEKLKMYLKSSTSMASGMCKNRATGKIIRALVPMHTFGHPSKLSELQEICKEFNIVMVEDAAESLGSFYENRHTGTFGLLGTLSFNGNKTITTGGGGAILTNDSSLAEKAKHLTTTAKVPHKWSYVHDEIGFNYRLPNLNAALGCAQLESLETKISRKRQLFERYQSCFEDIQGVSILEEPKGCRSNYWLQTLILDANMEGARDSILDRAHELRVATRPAWNLINTLKPFQSFPSMETDQASEMVNRIINIPSSPQLISASS